MKLNTLKNMALILAFAVCVSVFGACGVDPNVNHADTTSDYEVKIDDEAQETEREGFYAYGKGKTDPVKVDGVEVNVKDFAVRSFELGYMMAQSSFKKPSDISTDVAVQYAFTHIFFKDFYSINNKAVQYRSATQTQIKDMLKKHFGTDDFDITSSMLYNSGKKMFEMWIPEYGTNIYYIIDAVNVESDEVEIITTFYNELARKTLYGRTTLRVRIKNGKPVIYSLKAE